jgi:hypothetical protein
VRGNRGKNCENEPLVPQKHTKKKKKEIWERIWQVEKMYLIIFRNCCFCTSITHLHRPCWFLPFIHRPCESVRYPSSLLIFCPFTHRPCWFCPFVHRPWRFNTFTYRPSYSIVRANFTLYFLIPSLMNPPLYIRPAKLALFTSSLSILSIYRSSQLNWSHSPC